MRSRERIALVFGLIGVSLATGLGLPVLIRAPIGNPSIYIAIPFAVLVAIFSALRLWTIRKDK